MVLEVVHKSTMRAQVKNGLGGAGNTVVPRPNPAKEG